MTKNVFAMSKNVQISTLRWQKQPANTFMRAGRSISDLSAEDQSSTLLISTLTFLAPTATASGAVPSRSPWRGMKLPERDTRASITTSETSASVFTPIAIWLELSRRKARGNSEAVKRRNATGILLPVTGRANTKKLRRCLHSVSALRPARQPYFRRE